MSTAVAEPPMASLEDVLHAHTRLLEQYTSPKVVLGADEVRGFLARAGEAGAFLSSIGDREAARSVLNYWTAMLADFQRDDPNATYPGATTLAPFDPARAPKLDESRNPFKGLVAFEESDANDFRGREDASTLLLERVMRFPIMTVSGASGTGKSSLVAAGLIPRLRQQAGVWTVRTLAPGSDPVGNLLVALRPKGAPADWVAINRDRLEADPKHAAVLAVALAGDTRLLLVIDQFEEMFTLALELDDRALTARALAAIAVAPGDPRVVLSMREEYRAAVAELPELGAFLVEIESDFRVLPMSPVDLRRAVVEPADRAGLLFEDGVVDQIVADVAAEPAALPLLQFALTNLWKNRDHNRITRVLYERLGGPARALAEAAEKAYASLTTPEAKENARVVFQRLVRPSLEHDGVRDRITRRELEGMLQPTSVRRALKPFVDAGLVLEIPGRTPGDDRFEVAHEALIRNWPKLRDWVAELREREIVYLRLCATAEAWQRAGRSSGYLLSGEALRDAEAGRDDRAARIRPGQLDARGRQEATLADAFLAASRERRVRRSRLRWSWSSALGLLLLLLLTFGVYQLSVARDREVRLLAQQVELSNQTSRSIQLAEVVATAMPEDAAAEQTLRRLVLRGRIDPADLPFSLRWLADPVETLDFEAQPAPFDRRFLGMPLPIETDALVRDLVPLEYTHFRLWFDRSSGLVRFGASNSDRSAPQANRLESALFRDGRVDRQFDETELAATSLGHGQLVDAREVAWGSHAEQIAAGRGINALPNQFPVDLGRNAGNRLDAWASVSTWFTAKHNPSARRVIYLSGLVPATDGDPRLRPAVRLWKLAISRRGDSADLVVDAAMLPVRRRGEPGDLPGRVTLREFARQTGLPVGGLLQSTPTPVDMAAAAAAFAAASTPATAAPAAPSAAVPTRIYIQFAGLDRARIERVRDRFNTGPFRSPAIEEVPSALGRREIIFFYPADRPAAERAAAIAREALGAERLGTAPVRLKPRDYRNFRNARPGTIELWIGGPR